MIIDESKINLIAGNGGDGAVSFRRERFVSKGGPDGGDGGNGGNIWFEVRENLDTLSQFRNKQLFIAENGQNGRPKKMHGKNGEDIIISVPPGTLVTINGSTHDLTKIGERFLAAAGGRGGWGNWHFATSIKQTPDWSKSGLPGNRTEAKLELNLIADVGLVGLPNAGKSTLLSVLSSAKPVIADYPFTTLDPQLGVFYDNDNKLVIADVPGLISGARFGKGLGTSFLKHLKRTAVLLYLIDASSDISEQIRVLDDETKQLNKPSLLVFNKIDLIDKHNLSKLQKKYPKAIFISALTGENLNNLKTFLTDQLKTDRIQ